MTDLVASRQPFVDGAYVPVAQASIPILDWGFLRGDATYDVVHVWDGAFFRLEEHLDRFERRTLSVVRIGWKALVAGAALGVAISHGAALKAMGTSRRQFVRRVLHDRDETARWLFDPDRRAT